MKTILITGSKGQLGNEIEKLSKDFEFNFIFTDVEELNITDKNAVNLFFQKNKIDFIINCAAYTSVDKAETEKVLAEMINVDAVLNLKNAAEKANAFLIHVSTDYVFDGQNYKPYNEDDKVNPPSIYGKTKLEGEKVLENFSKGMIIRTSWLYSAFGNNFVKTMLRLGKERDELNVVFDQIGTPTNAADLAAAILEIVNKIIIGNNEFIPGIYHYSNEGVCSWYDFAKEIMSFSELTCKVNPIESKDFPTPAKRPFYSVLNKEKIKNTYKIDIPYWKDSLIKCINQLNDS